MGLQRSLLSIAERVTKTRIYPTWRITTRGIDLFEDIGATLPGVRIHTVFDVGANVGQSTGRYLREFEDATIYSFEPASDTFSELRRSLGAHARVRTYQLALGASHGAARLVHQGNSELFYLLKDAAPPDGAVLEDVPVSTLASFCADNQIERINFLKIDTEGSDLDVLNGAREMLITQRVDILQVEAGMNHLNRRHVPVEDLKAFLESSGYFLFGLYEQIHEWPTNKPHLRRCNLVFISERVIQAH